MSYIRVKYLKTLRNENQLAELLFPKKMGTAIVDKGRVKLGWVLCRAKEKVINTRCYKCLEYGHDSVQCISKEDRSKNCGPFSAICKKEGHRIGTINAQEESQEREAMG